MCGRGEGGGGGSCAEENIVKYTFLVSDPHSITCSAGTTSILY